MGLTISPQTVTETQIVLSDVTLDNVSIAAHGFAPKLPNDATKYLNGLGAYTAPAGGASISKGKIVAIARAQNML